MCEKIPQENSRFNYRDTNNKDVNALIGLLLLASILKSNNESMDSLESKVEFSYPIFKATVSGKRYTVPVVSFSLDETLTQDIRKTTDKAAAISEIFNKIISKSQAVYRFSAYVTIDKMLIPFRGHCAFKMYTPKKNRKI